MDHPFPPVRPGVKIVKSASKIDEIDCPELQWWFAVPNLSDRTAWAAYDAETLELTAVTKTVATAHARIHQVDCVELQLNQWTSRDYWPKEFNPGSMYGLLEDESARWIAVLKNLEDTKEFYSVADEGFMEDWGEPTKRKLFDDGRYLQHADGSYVVTDGVGLGAGVYDVTIGDNTFTCLRVLDPDLSVPGGGELVEAYVERGGRTVFFRRYDSQHYRGTDLVEKYPNNSRLVINGNVFVHCDCTGRAHDTLTCLALSKH